MRSSSKDVQLRWEGAAGRPTQSKLLVQVQEIKAASEGLLGKVGNHPSLAASMPEPMDLKASVLRHSGSWSGSSLSLRFPRPELPDAAVDDRLALGVIGQDVCICLARVPSSVADAALDEWLAKWACP